MAKPKKAEEADKKSAEPESAEANKKTILAKLTAGVVALTVFVAALLNLSDEILKLGARIIGEDSDRNASAGAENARDDRSLPPDNRVREGAEPPVIRLAEKGRIEIPATGPVRVTEDRSGNRSVVYCPGGYVLRGNDCELPDQDSAREQLLQQQAQQQQQQQQQQPPAPPPLPSCPGSPGCPLPPPPLEVTAGPFIVFFDWDRADITPQAAAILDDAAAGYQSATPMQVVLTAHTDRSGPADYNLGLSQRRADSVREYLAGRGVPVSAIAAEAFGESRPLVQTADGVREPQNRRVEVLLSPSSLR